MTKLKLNNKITVEAGLTKRTLIIKRGDKVIKLTSTTIGEMIRQNNPGDVFHMNCEILHFLLNR